MRAIRGRGDPATDRERPPCPEGMEAFYTLDVKGLWQYFKGEHFSFWMICGYLFVEYVRPQSILPWLDFLPWAQLFVLGALAGWLMDHDRKWVGSPINKWMVLRSEERRVGKEGRCGWGGDGEKKKERLKRRGRG